MYDFTNIVIERSGDNLLVIKNPTLYPVIGQGRQGIVFRLAPKVCVKIYADENEAQIEALAYKRFSDSTIAPKLCETGKNYIIMEFIDGPSLKDYLVRKGYLSKSMTQRILYLFHEMKRLGFKRMDAALRHILVAKNKELKLIDHFHAYSFDTPYPVKFFEELQHIGMLSPFLENASELDTKLYQYWKNGMHENFIDIEQ